MQIEEQINRILSYNTLSVNQKIDQLLKIDSIQYTNLGKDSLDQEVKIVKQNSIKIYKAISKLNTSIGELLLSTEKNNA